MPKRGLAPSLHSKGVLNFRNCTFANKEIGRVANVLQAESQRLKLFWGAHFGGSDYDLFVVRPQQKTIKYLIFIFAGLIVNAIFSSPLWSPGLIILRGRTSTSELLCQESSLVIRALPRTMTPSLKKAGFSERACGRSLKAKRRVRSRSERFIPHPQGCAQYMKPTGSERRVLLYAGSQQLHLLSDEFKLNSPHSNTLSECTYHRCTSATVETGTFTEQPNISICTSTVLLPTQI